MNSLLAAPELSAGTDYLHCLRRRCSLRVVNVFEGGNASLKKQKAFAGHAQPNGIAGGIDYKSLNCKRSLDLQSRERWLDCALAFDAEVEKTSGSSTGPNWSPCRHPNPGARIGIVERNKVRYSVTGE